MKSRALFLVLLVSLIGGGWMISSIGPGELQAFRRLKVGMTSKEMATVFPYSVSAYHAILSLPDARKWHAYDPKRAEKFTGTLWLYDENREDNDQEAFVDIEDGVVLFTLSDKWEKDYPTIRYKTPVADILEALPSTVYVGVEHKQGSLHQFDGRIEDKQDRLRNFTGELTAFTAATWFEYHFKIQMKNGRVTHTSWERAPWIFR